MNILPKKKWHVRTKDNIARVRRDEAEAQEKERILQGKLQLAESEARINFLRHKNNLHCEQQTIQKKTNASTEPTDSVEHFNLFEDFKSHIKTTNKQLEKEKKDEQEKYEKQIGYLTYLGQDTNEALKLKSWYELPPKRPKLGENIDEKDTKKKQSYDPLTLINVLVPAEKIAPKIQKKSIITETRETKATEINNCKQPADSRSYQKGFVHKHSKKEKRHKKEGKIEKSEDCKQRNETMDKLRKERLRREAKERERQEALFAPQKQTLPEQKAPTTPRIVQKYNSQFNPEIAKQNIL